MDIEGVFSCSVAERNRLCESISAIRLNESLPIKSFESEVSNMETSGGQILRDAIPRLAQWLSDRAGRPFRSLHVRGLVWRDEPVQTFYDGRIRLSRVWKEILSLAGTFNLLGLSMVGYQRKNGGSILRSVAPTKEGLNQLGSQGSANRLPLHIDNADLFFPAPIESRHFGQSISARYIGWAQINFNPLAPMEYVVLDDVLACHSFEDDLQVLSAPLFDVDAPDSIGGDRSIENVPVLLRDPEGGFVSRFNEAKVHARGLQAQLAFSRFALTANRRPLRRVIYPLPGDLVVLDNFQCLHGRSGFPVIGDGTDRQMIRVYGMTGTDLAASQSALPSSALSRIL